MTTSSTSPTSRHERGDGPVAFGPARRAVRLGGVVSGILDTRAVALSMICLAACAVLFVVAVASGAYPVPLADIVAIVTGRDRGFANQVVLEWRLPRATAAAVFGAALGLSGAIFQSVTRNPLGSPDLIGFNAGAYTGALVAIGWFGGSLGTRTVLALAGGGLAAVVVYLLAFRHGVSGTRLVVVGIAVSMALTGVSGLLVLRMSPTVAIVASTWGQGTLENIRWSQVTPMCAAIAAVTLATALLGGGLRQLELGDEAARASGTNVERLRLALIALGVGLTAIVTSVSGPIVFVALPAPQIARLLARSSGTTLIGSAAVGAVMLSASDLVAVHLFPVAIPVGVVTVVIGGGYLMALVARRSGR